MDVKKLFQKLTQAETINANGNEIKGLKSSATI